MQRIYNLSGRVISGSLIPGFAAVVFVWFPLFLSAEDVEERFYLNSTDPAVPTATARILNQEGITLDGRLEESSWQGAEVLTNFTQHEPDEGMPATEKTEIRILYSEDSLYIGARAFDSEADKIRAILARRDSPCPSDWISVWIDSYHDHLTAFQFSVNPCGVKRDVFWTRDYRPDEDWDAVWDVEVSTDDRGWTAEFKIPFSQIRFPKRDSHTWGFQAQRVIARTNEISYWRHIPRGVPRFVSLFGELTGIRDIPSPRRLQVLPYTLGKGAFGPAQQGNHFETGSDLVSNIGLDLKYGLTSNLTLDASINPDFGQVEADPAQVNLTAYETYFDEKRPFFIEGRTLLSFPIGVGEGGESLFYSRRIGRAPQGPITNAAYSERPDNTSILGAVKITGKTSSGWSIGVMEALTGQESARVQTWNGSRSDQVVEPLTNYFLGRAQKDFREGRSTLGLIFTAVNRNIENESLEFLRKSAYSGGFNFRHRWRNDTYEVSGNLVGSHIQGSEQAILQAQRSSSRYYQRPDATHLTLDPHRTSLSGFAGRMAFSKIGGGHWRWALGGFTQSPGFEVNDMGYMRDVDSIISYLYFSYREYKPGKIFRDYSFSLTLYGGWDYEPVRTGGGGNIRAEFNFLNYWRTTLTLSRSQESLSSSQLRGGPALLMPGNWSLNGILMTDTRKDFLFFMGGRLSVSDNQSHSYSLNGGITLRPSDRFEITMAPGFGDGYRQLQYVTKKSSDSGTRYILGRIDQTTVSMTVRLNYTLTPTLSIQLYSQPYISAAGYSSFKEVVAPRAASYDDRWHVFSGSEAELDDGYYRLRAPHAPDEEIAFSNPDFNFRQFRSNLVLRWEYLPGSTLYVVWSSGMNDYANSGRLNLGEDFQDLFTSPSHNIFLIKASYWFNL